MTQAVAARPPSAGRELQTAKASRFPSIEETSWEGNQKSVKYCRIPALLLEQVLRTHGCEQEG